MQQLMEYATELQKRNVELRRLNIFKNEFLATTTHELRYVLTYCYTKVERKRKKVTEHRTPLNAITACTSLLYDTSLDEEQRNHVQTIERSALAQLRLVNDLIDTSKIQGNNAGHKDYVC